MTRPDEFDRLIAAAEGAARADPAESERLAAQAVAAAEAAGDDRGAAVAGRVRVQAFLALGRAGDALAASHAAAGRAATAGDPLLEAQVRIGAVDALGRLGHPDEAVALGERLVGVLEAGGARDEAAKVRANLGILHYRRDRYAEALDQYGRAATVFEESGDAVSLARVRVNEANSLTALGRAEESVARLEAARAVFDAGGLPVFAAVADINQGHLHHASGRHARALQLLDRAREAFTAVGDDEGCAQCDLDSAEAYRALNLHPEALACCERAAVAFTRLSADRDRARAEAGRAAALASLGRTEEALASLDTAEADFRRQRSPAQRANVVLLRAHLLWEAGRGAEAASEAGRAARAFSRAGLPGGAAEARWVSAARALRAGGAGSPALRGMRAVAEAARAYGRGWLECRAEGEIGRHFARLGQTGRALPHLRAAVEALERARTLIAPEEMHAAFLRDKVGAYEVLVAALLSIGRPEDVAEALGHVERAKSRLLLERVLAAAEGRPSEQGAQQDASDRVRRRLAELRAELSRLYHQEQEGGPASGGAQRRVGASAPPVLVSELERTYLDAVRAAERDVGDAALAPVVPPEELRTALVPDEALVEFYGVGGRVCAFVLTEREGLRAAVGVADLADVAAAARTLRYHLQKAATLPREYAARYAGALEAEARAALRRLWDLLLAPLAPQIERCRLLTLVPHGALHGLPFHAFFDGDRYAVDRWEFAYAPSAGVWHVGARRRAQGGAPSPASVSGSALLLGAPDPNLPRIGEEIRALCAVLPGARALEGAAATTEAFRAHAPNSRLIHLATHAQFRPENPLFSGLRFADGWLLARDLYGMRLNGCWLATLSACRTGVGRVEAGDELFGLLRGFLAAGARSVAASLWPVDDAATARLMARFYERLPALGKAAALCAAARETREENPHPYHWAPFLLVGER